ncbi:MAG: DUF366 family protein [Peptococcaceae bacterium]|nr:DUF366 family protein [Peptococcaceae bacterium]
MHVYTHGQRITYTGHQLSSLWAYRSFGLQGDSIVCFRGPCRIDPSEMVDVEDVLGGAKIYGPDMLHFIVEHFGEQLEKGVLRQRILMAIIKDVLGRPQMVRRGDDLYLGERKLSISIATASPVSVMIHAALNVVSEGTPVKTVGLFDLGYSEDDILDFGRKVCTLYGEEMSSVRLACCKVRGVG